MYICQNCKEEIHLPKEIRKFLAENISKGIRIKCSCDVAYGLDLIIVIDVDIDLSENTKCFIQNVFDYNKSKELPIEIIKEYIIYNKKIYEKVKQKEKIKEGAIHCLFGYIHPIIGIDTIGDTPESFSKNRIFYNPI